MAKFEKPQSGNPHQLTVHQHCFPRSCIERFADASGVVEVKLNKSSNTFKAQPDNKVFCAKRAWDQRAERGYMLKIENEYREFAERVIASGGFSFSSEGHSLISAMYCLWSLRESMRDADIDEGPAPGVTGLSRELTKDQMEMLEKNHIASMRPDLTFPARHITGALIQLRLDHHLRDFKGTKWHIAESGGKEFLVPDSSLRRMILPLSPTICFYHEHERTTLGGVKDVAEFNRQTEEGSILYTFCRFFGNT